MKVTQLLKDKKLYLLAFFLPALLMWGAYILFGVYPFGQESALVLDLNAQYIQYYEGLKNALFGDGSIFYSWSRNLSGEYMGIIGYYLASPFSLIPLLLPHALIVDSILIMELCKVGACGVTFLVYLNKRKDAGFSALPFAIMYALMSYSVVEAMNPMWIDGLIFLPLIILGIERLVDEGRIVGFIVALAWMFAANFYIGYMIGIFSILYFFIYCYLSDSYKSGGLFLRKAARFALGGAISLACAAAMLLPVYYSLKLGKMEFTDPQYTITAKFSLMDFFAKFLPQSYDSVNVQGLPFVFCGILALLLVPLFFINAKIPARLKIGGGLALLAVLICMYVSILDLALHGFQWPNWLNYRYSFVFSFIMLSLAYRAFLHMDGVQYKHIIATCGILIVAVILIEKQGYSFISTTGAVWLSFILLASYAVLLTLAKKQSYQPLLLVLTVIVCSEMFVNMQDSFEKIDEEVLYSTRDSYMGFYEDNKPIVDKVQEQDTSFYRMEKLFHRTVNDPLMLGFAGLSHSSSTLNARPIELLRVLGYTSRGHYTKYKGGTIVSDALLGVKYVLSNTNMPMFYTEAFTESTVSVYENPYAMPIGFTASSDILSATLDTVNPFEAQNKLLNALLGTNTRFFEQVAISTPPVFSNVSEIDAVDQMRYVPVVAGQDAHIDYSFSVANATPLYLFMPTKYERKANLWLDGAWVGTYYEGDDYCIVSLGEVAAGSHTLTVTLNGEELFMQDRLLYSFDEAAFAQAIDTLKASGSTFERKSDTHLIATTSATEDTALFTSIPYEPGWTVRIDGKAAEPVMVANSLMAVEVPAGEHTIELTFFPKGLAPGLVLTFIGIALTVLLYLMRKKGIVLFSFMAPPAIAPPASPAAPALEAPEQTEVGE